MRLEIMMFKITKKPIEFFNGKRKVTPKIENEITEAQIKVTPPEIENEIEHEIMEAQIIEAFFRGIW